MDPLTDTSAVQQTSPEVNATPESQVTQTTPAVQTTPAESVALNTPAPSTPTPAPQLNVRETLRSLGFEQATQLPDDRTALEYLASATREAQSLRELAQHGRQYIQHADQFQAWLRERQEHERRTQEQSQNWWKAPEYDPGWLSKLVRDPQTGEIRALPGSDPTIVPKYLAWVEHQRQFMDRFSQNPIEAIRPGIEQIIEAKAQQMIQQHLGQYREQQQAAALLEQNSSWMQQQDPATGRPVLTEWGRRYAG